MGHSILEECTLNVTQEHGLHQIKLSIYTRDHLEDIGSNGFQELE